MLNRRGNRFAVIAAAAAAVAAGIAAPSRAATVTWNATTPPGNWSDPANWTGGAGVPVAADSVVFGAIGSSATQGTVTNVVDQNFTIGTVTYSQRSDNVPAEFHTTQVNAGNALNVTGTGTSFFVGTGLGAPVTQSVYTTFTGDGALNINNTAATVQVRQGMTTSGTGNAALRATLDLSNLKTFSANVSAFNVGVGDGSGTNFNRAAGTVILPTIAGGSASITANTMTVSFVSASGSNQSQLYLGTNNNINVNTIEVGQRKANGLIAFRGGVTDGLLTLRSQTGGRATWNIGAHATNDGTGTAGQGTVDLTADTVGGTRGSGTVDALVSTLLVGRSNNSTGNGTGRLTYDKGTIDASQVIIGENGTGTAIGRGTLEVKGTGNLIVGGNVTMARTAPDIGILNIGNTGANASVAVTGDIIDAGGTTTITVTDGSLKAAHIGTTNAIDTFTLNNAKLQMNVGATAGANVGAFTANGTNVITPGLSGAVTPGTDYVLIDYASIAGTGFGSFSLAKLPPRMTANLLDNATNGSIDLHVTAFDAPKWTGSGDQTWNTASTNNWQLINAGTATTYQEDLATYSTADNVTFDDSTANGNVNLNSTVSPGSITVSNSSTAYTIAGTGAIAGAPALTKTGSQTLTIANTGGNAVGGISIGAGGTVQIGNNSTAGAGLGSYGAISNAGTLELKPAAGDSLNLAGVISGAGSLKHSGAGTSTLAATNTYTGSTDITAGTVVVTGNNSFGPITAGSAAVNISGTGGIDLVGAPAALDFSTNKVFNIAGSGTAGAGAIQHSGTTAIQNAFEKINLTDDATINLNARVDIRGTDTVRGNLNLNGKTLTKKGTGQFTVVRSDVTDGNINVEAGSLRFETSTNVPAGAGNIAVGPGATLAFFQNTGDISRQIVLNGGIVNDVNQTHTATINSPITLTSDSTFDLTNSTGMTFAGAINGAGGLTKTGNGTMALSGASSFTGKLAASAGKLNLLSNQAGSSSLEASGTGVIELANDGSFNKVIRTGNVSIADTAKVDLKNNKLVTDKPIGVATGGVYSGLQGDVQRAYNFGSWDQPGLTTSEPDAGPLVGLTTIGVATGEQVLFLGPTQTGTWAGQTVTGASTLAMYTYAGDMNFDGLVDGGDYGIIDNFFATPGSDGYANGDLNYDGVIDGGDYGIIDNTFSLQGAPIPTGADIVAAGGSAAAAASLSGVTAVPEPASLSMLGIAAAAMLGRRRRRTITK